MRFYAMHCVIGFLVSAIFVATLMYFNVANLWHLISNSDIGIMALVVFWVLNGIVFAGVQTAIAVMRMADDTDENVGPKGGPTVAVQLAESHR
jgi:hypothetical protein